jgi:hypothetical protein
MFPIFPSTNSGMVAVVGFPGGGSLDGFGRDYHFMRGFEDWMIDIFSQVHLVIDRSPSGMITKSALMMSNSVAHF